MISEISVLRDSYRDSVRLLEATRSMQALAGVDYGWTVMATAANLATLTDEGFDMPANASANDLLIAIRAESTEVVTEAQKVANATLFRAIEPGDHTPDAPISEFRVALAFHPATNFAIVSVPGPYATLETQKALSAGLDVLLFSDNVPLEDEIALKKRAVSLGRLVMGPGAGTAMIAGTGLGFSNRVRPGRVGVVAAAGTGAQEVMSLLDRWGAGVTHVIGVGGRDLSSSVGGLMAESAIAALDDHEATEVILLVSKPPAPEVAQALLGGSRSKPVVAALIGLSGDLEGVPSSLPVCSTLEQGAVLTLKALGLEVPDVIGDTPAAVADLISGLVPSRKRLVGLFSGGSLCYEAMTIGVRHLGPIHSNTPLDPAWGLPAPEGVHVCLDLGEEEYTEGRPHPMIDPEARISWLKKQVDDPSVAVVLLDVVIGDGAHANPASLLAPMARQIVDSGAAVVAYVLGTDQDPQGLEDQRRILRKAGCIVTETAARAALAAAALVNRDPALVCTDLGE